MAELETEDDGSAMQYLEDAMHELFGFLGNSDPSSWASLFVPLVGAIMIFAIPISAIITDYFQKRDRARLLEKAIERGVPVESLKFEEESKPQRLPYRSGMVTVAVGLGIVILGLSVGNAITRSGVASLIGGSYLTGGGILVLLIGLALLINDWMNRKRFLESGNNGK